MNYKIKLEGKFETVTTIVVKIQFLRALKI